MRMDDSSAEKWRLADEEVRKNLPPGVKLVRTLRGHTGKIGRITWSPDGKILASPSLDETIQLWDAETGVCLRTLKGHKKAVYSVSFDRNGRMLVSGGKSTVKIWEIETSELLQSFEGREDDWFTSVSFHPVTDTLAYATPYDGLVKLHEARRGQLLQNLGGGDGISSIAYNPSGNLIAYSTISGTIKIFNIPTQTEISLFSREGAVNSITFDPREMMLASGDEDHTVKLWDTTSGKLLRTLEGHTSSVKAVVFISDSGLLSSRSSDGTIRLWNGDTGACIAMIPEITSNESNYGGLAFNPLFSLLATVGSDPGASDKEQDKVIHIWKLDITVLLSQPAAEPTVSYTSAKVVLVGDSSVGKTGLGWRLAHGEFKEHSSTHGQQFWLLKQLCKKRSDGAQCEAVLWDLAGQPDYRLIHALFLDDADLALILFDPTRDDNPLSGVEFWLKQLKVEAQSPNGTPTVLIAARSDRGTPRLTLEELNTFCKQRGIKAYILTSAKSGEGIDDLVQKMQNMIQWDNKPATVTTETFKRIKDFVLNLKEKSRRRKMILTPKELRQRLQKTDRKWKFSDAEMITAVGHLENHGYLTRLKTSQGETRILLAPELLNNLAASFILEARRNQEGLGSLEEQRLLSGEYKFPELEKLTEAEQNILLDSGAVLFLEHNVCFRENNPLNNRAYLVFPELINMKKPLIGDDIPTEDGVAYTVSGAVENVYASLVVLMGYTQTFTRTNHWQDHARYEMGNGFVCGFRLEEERAGELDFVLYFGTNTPTSVKILFQGLFENFLARRNLTVRRFEPVECSNKHKLNRAVVRELLSSGEETAFCSRCGERLTLPKADKPIHLSEDDEKRVEENRREADQRSRFEQVLFRLKSYVTDQKIASPECFISYAWGIQDHESWVERKLAMDLQKAGIIVLLDRWENARIGASVPRFVERVGKTDRVIVVGTPLYQEKYDNDKPMGGFVLAAEGDLIGKRMIGSEAKKESVLPILLDGSDESSFPLLLQGRVYADFRKPKAYFGTALDLLLSLYNISPQQPVSIELREFLRGRKEF